MRKTTFTHQPENAVVPYPKLTCKQCGGSYYVRPSAAKVRQYCGMSCSRRAYWAARREEAK